MAAARRRGGAAAAGLRRRGGGVAAARPAGRARLRRGGAAVAGGMRSGGPTRYPGPTRAKLATCVCMFCVFKFELVCRKTACSGAGEGPQGGTVSREGAVFRSACVVSGCARPRAREPGHGVRLVAACTLHILKLAETLAFKGTKIAIFASRGAAPHPAGGTSPQTPSYMSAVLHPGDRLS